MYVMTRVLISCLCAEVQFFLRLWYVVSGIEAKMFDALNDFQSALSVLRATWELRYVCVPAWVVICRAFPMLILCLSPFSLKLSVALRRMCETFIYRKWPNNSRSVYLFQSLNRPGVYSGPVGNSGKVFNSIDVHPLQVKLLRQRKLFSQPALATNSSSVLSLTVAYICFAISLIILRDTPSWRAS